MVSAGQIREERILKKFNDLIKENEVLKSQVTELKKEDEVLRSKLKPWLNQKSIKRDRW